MIKYVFIIVIYIFCFFDSTHKKHLKTNIPTILTKISSLSINHLTIYEECIEIEGKTQTFNKLFKTLKETPLCSTLKTKQEKTYVYFTT